MYDICIHNVGKDVERNNIQKHRDLGLVEILVILILCQSLIIVLYCRAGLPYLPKILQHSGLSAFHAAQLKVRLKMYVVGPGGSPGVRPLEGASQCTHRGPSINSGSLKASTKRCEGSGSTTKDRCIPALVSLGRMTRGLSSLQSMPPGAGH